MSLFVGNLPENSSRELLEEEFSKFGKCQVNFFGKFAFVEYQLETEAEEARRTWDSREFHGQTLKVEISQISPGSKGPQSRTAPDKEAGKEPPEKNLSEEPLEQGRSDTRPLETDNSDIKPLENTHSDIKPPEAVAFEQRVPEHRSVDPLLIKDDKFGIENDKGIEEMMKGINEPPLFLQSMDGEKSELSQMPISAEEALKIPGKRGRPRKVTEEGSEASKGPTTDAPVSTEVKIPKKRGRPRKIPLAEGEEPPKRPPKVNLLSHSDNDLSDDDIATKRAARTRKAREVQPVLEGLDSDEDDGDEEIEKAQILGSEGSSDYSPKSDEERNFLPPKDPLVITTEDGTVFRRVRSKYVCSACNKGIMLNSINTHVKSSLHKRHKPS